MQRFWPRNIALNNINTNFNLEISILEIIHNQKIIYLNYYLLKLLEYSKELWDLNGTKRKGLSEQKNYFEKNIFKMKDNPLFKYMYNNKLDLILFNKFRTGAEYENTHSEWEIIRNQEIQMKSLKSKSLDVWRDI